ncbi:hypothetical protein MSG28_015525 [Choristoneura fumiferana]|uniref:Uncharacterized protein n=1 Tax=Choristoneura fumiferana TaxID=7141 RepID=A0ACC0KBB4_CHOFU|nr:hypothetical protein MSG28_015525 [Choristoneura fumiferana]
MDEKAIFKICKDEGCCDACCLRYLGLKHPRTYENVKESYMDEPTEGTVADNVSTESSEPAKPEEQSNGTNGVAGDSVDQAAAEGAPAAKRSRGAPCRSCLGLLQEAAWDDACRAAKDELDKKRYEVSEFACALSAPLSALLREHYMVLTVRDTCPQYGAVRRRSVPPALSALSGTLYGATVRTPAAVRRRSVPPALSALLRNTIWCSLCGHLPAVRRRSVPPALSALLREHYMVLTSAGHPARSTAQVSTTGAERAAQGHYMVLTVRDTCPQYGAGQLPPALSALLREHYMVLTVRDTCPQYGAGQYHRR